MNKKTNKTAHVLKLLSDSRDNVYENPIINEDFKVEKIHTRKSSPEAVAEVSSSPEIKINLVAEIIDEKIDQVMERFNLSEKQDSKSKIVIDALNQIEPKYISISNAQDIKLMNTLKREYEQSITNVLVKLAISYRCS